MGTQKVNTKSCLPAEQAFPRYKSCWGADISRGRDLDLLVVSSLA